MKINICIVFSLYIFFIGFFFSADEHSGRTFCPSTVVSNNSNIYERKTSLNEEHSDHKNDVLLPTFEVDELIQRQSRYRLAAIKLSQDFDNFCSPEKKVLASEGNRHYPPHFTNQIPIYIMVSSMRI